MTEYLFLGAALAGMLSLAIAPWLILSELCNSTKVLRDINNRVCWIQKSLSDHEDDPDDPDEDETIEVENVVAIGRKAA